MLSFFYKTFILLGLFFFNLSSLASPIIPDGSTNTSVLNNIVNIAAPNKNGTSINNYTHFNVPVTGAVLNNSPNNVFSEVVGGQIVGNANFRNNAAAYTIINQVTSNNPSFLNGKLEIAGQKANLIIANPNGIKINGGQFLNTGITSLITGQALVNSRANNDEIHLITNSGEIEIGAIGLSGFMDSLNLISKTLKIQGPITNSNSRLSSSIKAITGQSRLTTITRADSLPNLFSEYFTNIPIPSSGANNPEFIVNLDQVGGITASKISILVTDKGAGVNFGAGSIDTKSDFEILADGKIYLKDHQINTKGDTHLKAHEVKIKNSQILANQNIELNSEFIDLKTSTLFSSNDLNLAGNLIKSSNQSSLKAKGYLNIGANNIEFDHTEINIGRKSDITANNFTFQNPLSTWQSEDIVFNLSNSFKNIGAAIDGRNSIDIQAINLNQLSGAYLLSSNGTINLDISDQVNNSASLIKSLKDLNVQSTNLNNTNSQILSTNSNISLITNNLSNQNSLIQSQKNLSITSEGQITNFQNGIIFSKNGDMSLKAGRKIFNYGSRILSNYNLSLEAPTIINYTTQKPIQIKYFTRKGSRFLWKRKTIKGWHEFYPELETKEPIIFANKNLSIKASNAFQNIGGQVIANDGNIKIDTANFLNQALRVGQSYYEENCRFLCSTKGYSYINIKGGRVSAGNQLNINAHNLIENRGGSLIAVNTLSLKAPQVKNIAYPIYRFRRRYRGLKFWETAGWQIYTLDSAGTIIASLRDKIRFYSDTPVQNYGGLILTEDGIESSSEIENLRRNYKRNKIGLFEVVFELMGI